MRLAFLAQPTDTLTPPVQGGSLALWIYQVARQCASCGHAVSVLANHGGALRVRSVSHEGVDYLFTPTAVNRTINRVARLAQRGRQAGSLARPEFAAAWSDAGYALLAAREARRAKCEVVHIMNYSQFAPIVRRTYPRAKIALHMECEWLTQLDAGVIDRRLDSVDLVIGCSEYITGLIARRFPRHSSRCVTVPNAAPLVDDVGPRPERSARVLFVGRVSPEKGVHDLVVAFRRVLDRFPAATLHVAGGIGSAPYELLVGLSNDPKVRALESYYDRESHPPRDIYEGRLRELAGAELGSRIFFEGRVLNSRVGELYRDAALVVNPSLSEAFGMSLVEAMMYRVPVVATSVGGMTEIVQATGGGLLVDSANPDALAEAMCVLLADPERATAMGARARRVVVEVYSWPAISDLLLRHFQALLQTRERATGAAAPSA